MAKHKIVRLKIKFNLYDETSGSTHKAIEERLAIKVRGGYYPLWIKSEHVEEYPNISGEEEVGEIEISKELNDKITYHFE